MEPVPPFAPPLEDAGIVGFSHISPALDDDDSLRKGTEDTKMPGGLPSSRRSIISRRGQNRSGDALSHGIEDLFRNAMEIQLDLNLRQFPPI
jgi:hypothetical protein